MVMSHPNCTLLMLTLNGSKPMIKYCKSSDVCCRKLLFQDFDHPEQITKPCIPCHCCDVCATNCYCELCAVGVNTGKCKPPPSRMAYSNSNHKRPSVVTSCE